MKKKLTKEVISLLNNLRRDAQMAIDGDWDVSAGTAKEGFQCQIDSINNILTKIKNQ